MEVRFVHQEKGVSSKNNNEHSNQEEVKRSDGVIKCSTVMKNTTISYLLFVFFILIMMLRTRFLFYEDRAELQYESEVRTEDERGDVSDAYIFVVQGPVRSWRNFSLHIEANTNSEYWAKHVDPVTGKRIEDTGGSVFRVQAYSNVELVTAMAVYVGNVSFFIDLRSP